MGKAQALRDELTRAADGLLAVLIAPCCAACAAPLERPTAGPVCNGCWTAIVRVVPPCCVVCGDPLPSWRVLSSMLGTCPRCRRAPGHITRGAAAAEYEGALRDILHAFKYDGRRSLAAPLARLMREAGADLLAGADCVVPVPLHPWRRLRRGFNQSEELAARLGPPVVHALRRTRRTLAQAGLNPAERRRNVRGAFRLAGFMVAERHSRRRGASRVFAMTLGAPDVRDRRVVLVDDVRTTGATLEACAAVLKEAGAREVRALTVARAALPRRR